MIERKLDDHGSILEKSVVYEFIKGKLVASHRRTSKLWLDSDMSNRIKWRAT